MRTRAHEPDPELLEALATEPASHEQLHRGGGQRPPPLGGAIEERQPQLQRLQLDQPDISVRGKPKFLLQPVCSDQSRMAGRVVRLLIDQALTVVALADS